jgi:hypothetical protein
LHGQFRSGILAHSSLKQTCGRSVYSCEKNWKAGSPIAGGLAGGITATLTGRSFQTGAEVYFGSTPSPTVTFISSASVQAVVPAATQTGTVPVTLVNPDGEEATLASGFTYVTTEESLHAEVLGVTPFSILEDTETEVTVRGRNLISAYTNGLVALRAPTRVSLAVLNLTTSRDEATGIEELTFTVRVTAAPPLAAMERVAIQVLASHRPGAASDGVFESSRQLFIVLPRALPVTIAFTDTLAADRPNLVIVAGRNLEGCSLDFGEGVTVHMQQSEDRTIAGIVMVTDTQASTTSGTTSVETVSKQLTVRSAAGDTVTQLEVSVAPSDDTSAASSESAGDSVATSTEPPDELSLTLAPVPDQQMLAPTEEESALFSLGGGAASSLVFDWSAFAFDILDLDFDFVIVNEVRLIPFFDGGGDHLQSPTPLPTAQSPITLNARASVTLSLAFTPTAVGSSAGTLTLREQGGEVLLVVALTGKGISASTAPVRKNVASAGGGATVTARNYTQDGVIPGAHFQPSYAVDGQRYMHLTSTDADGFWRDEHGLPSWLEVDFDGWKTIDEIDIFTAEDYPDYRTQADPSPAQTFTQYGVTAFDVQYWTGTAWQTVPGGSVTGNNLVWRRFIFPAVTTGKIRVVVNAAVDGVARIVEVEAWGRDAP